jgi:hypothetical protein
VRASKATRLQKCVVISSQRVAPGDDGNKVAVTMMVVVAVTVAGDRSFGSWQSLANVCPSSLLPLLSWFAGT